ncbi:MAG: Mov34/MPN/PAD-1 family protein [Roseibium sp.]|uniref:Mov34/MPN/PAD-1 family protein n=1 Tax=Roseibium sp. TaxID=1936156 RepID=UPI003D9C4EB4
MTKFALGTSGETLCIEQSVLNHFKKYQQTTWFSREAGGPLFSISTDREHRIVLAGGPFPKDIRKRSAFIPHRPSTQEFIDYQYSLGRHFVGTWHSHPQSKPIPSTDDIKTMSTLFEMSEHELNAFIYVIVGTGKLPRNLYICAWSNEGEIVLRQKTQSPDK